MHSSAIVGNDRSSDRRERRQGPRDAYGGGTRIHGRHLREGRQDLLLNVREIPRRRGIRGDPTFGQSDASDVIAGGERQIDPTPPTSNDDFGAPAPDVE